MREIERNIVSALIFSNDGKLLMGRKDPRKDGAYVDCWHLPGGGVEKGEGLRETLNREILEEAGMDISGFPAELVDDKGEGQTEKVLKDTGERVICKMRFNVFRVDIDKAADEIAVKTLDDLVEYHWFTPDEIPKAKITPPSQTLFVRLGLLK
ncbi:MAG: NUDIX hydrolase [Candidatus Pacebacteria bacterium]|nr:NUDIX hydrolase [Candidatus Paceibacterota bacterium]